MAEPAPEPSGVLPVDKPAGPTSHDVVAAARRALRTRRIGHAGTLDPFASGLLLLCVGPATRLAEYLTALPKTYRATLRLGLATDTDDLTGEVTARSDAWRMLDVARVEDALLAQRGTIEQLPPIYSAKKVDGVRAYAAARRGEEVQRRPVRVTVHRIELLDAALPDVEFEVECSSGTYIRAIARDVGEALGVGAHLRALRRTASGAYRTDAALSLDQLGDPARVAQALIRPAAALAHLPTVPLAAEEAARVRQGRAVAAPVDLVSNAPVALVCGGELVAVGERRGEDIHPRKVFT